VILVFGEAMICIPIIAKHTGEAGEKIARANPMADMLELRLDYMESFRLKEMLSKAAKPVIAAYRSQRKGGCGSADYDAISLHLVNAIDEGAAFVDVEYRMPRKLRRRFLERRGPWGVIISIHLLDGTPSSRKLEYIFKTLAATGADIVKIVTWAGSPEDNLRVLALIPMAHKLGIKIIALCMGPMGRLSRIASPLLGAYLTFASLEQGPESDDGQIPIMRMRDMLGLLDDH
jgi:3-dehydroquinate dehydratase-1